MDFRSFRWTYSPQPRFLPWFLIVILIFSPGIASCGSSFPIPKPESTVTQSISTPPPTYTPQPTPTASPTPVIPLAVLLAPQGSDPGQVKAAGTALGNLSAREGIRWEMHPSLSEADITPDLRLVIAFPPISGLEEIIQAAPGVQFLAIGVPGLQASPNLSQIGPQGARPEQAAFMAGILAAIITDDWRVGVISLSDTPDGAAARQAFLDGAVFFCGLCRQLYPPFYKYPLYVEFASGASQAEQLSAVNVLKDHFVKTVYLYPGASNPALLKALSEAGIGIIGGSSPGETLPAQWVATVQANPAGVLESLLSDLWQGKGGTTVPMPIEIIDVNPELLSPGRQALAEKFLDDIQAGVIVPSTNP